MFFRLPRFIRRYFKRTMNPMAESKAMSIRQKLSIAYAIIAWHAFGYVLYQVTKGNKSWPETYGLIPKDENDIGVGTSAVQYAKMLNIPNAQVYRVGFSGVKEAKIESLQGGAANSTNAEPAAINSNPEELSA